MGDRNWLHSCVGDRTWLDSRKGFQLISFMCRLSKWTWFQCSGSNLPFLVHGAKSQCFGVRWILTVSHPYTGTVHQLGTFMSEKLPNTCLVFLSEVCDLFQLLCIIFCFYLFSSWGNFRSRVIVNARTATTPAPHNIRFVISFEHTLTPTLQSVCWPEIHFLSTQLLSQIRVLQLPLLLLSHALCFGIT